jgi:hypothetical protein
MCPTNEDIKSAIRDSEANIYYAANAQMQKEKPGDLLFMTPQVIRRISDVYCTAPLPDESGSIRCKFAARRGSTIEYYSGKMKRTPDGWGLIEPSVIIRALKR